jgi:hypothetical protein
MLKNLYRPLRPAHAGIRNATHLIAGRAHIYWAAACFGIFFSPIYALDQQTAKPHPTALAHPFSGANVGEVAAPWTVAGLPGSTKPVTQFDIVQLGSSHVLRVRSDHSYGTLSHALEPQTTAGILRWSWRLEHPVEGTDLLKKAGDDGPVKVCALFDMPLDRLSFMQRSLLKMARSRTGVNLPAATLCYVWDQKLPIDTELPNAFTARVHFVVMDTSSSPLHQWVFHQRNLHDDFLRSFGAETDTVPPLLAIAVGADSDNTGGSSLAYVGDITLIEH